MALKQREGRDGNPMKALHVADGSEWRAWLVSNAKTSEGVWLLYYKKSSGKQRIPYEDALDEALCFGWIDSKIRKVDEASYAQRFTPRKPSSRWSASNVRRMERLIRDGRMTQAGMDAFASHQTRRAPPLPTQLPRGQEDRFKAQTAAWGNFERLSPSYRRLAIAWVAGAKKEETQIKRLNQLVESSAANKRLEFM